MLKLLLILLSLIAIPQANTQLPYKSTEIFGKQFKDQKIIHMFSLDEPANIEFQMKYSESSKNPTLMFLKFMMKMDKKDINF